MTEAKGSIYPDDWINVAKKDWHRMAVLLEDGDPDQNPPSKTLTTEFTEIFLCVLTML